MPTSTAKLAANRRNALRSTGPKTADGKRRVSQNALKHGLRSRDFSLASLIEPQALFNELQTLNLEFRPKTPQQQTALTVVAVCNVQLRAITDLELKVFQEHGFEREDLLRKLTRISSKIGRDLFAAHQLYRSVTNQQTQRFNSTS